MLAAFCCTVAANCSMLAEVSSTLLACLLICSEISPVSEASALVPRWISLAASRTCNTIFCRPPPIPLMASISWPTSSWRVTGRLARRSPAAYCRASAITARSGRVSIRRMRITNRPAKSADSTTPAIRKRSRSVVTLESSTALSTSPTMVQFQPGSGV